MFQLRRAIIQPRKTVNITAFKERVKFMNYIENGNADVEFICSKDKPNIFLIGDSIRLGYCETVKNTISDIANVFYVGDNCRNTQYVITNLCGWQHKFNCPQLVDIVHFNCGHWDIAHWSGSDASLTSEDEYSKNINTIIVMLRKLFVNAKIVFATTTPMNPRTNSEIERYNRIAVNVAESNGISVNDLNEFCRDWDSRYYADYCHFTKTAFECLGKEISLRLKNYLQDK